MDLIIEQPSWFLLLCFALGGLYSFLLYQKSIKQKVEGSNVLQWITAITRFVAVSFLAILVLNPLLKYVEQLLEKPVVFIAVDRSQSMMLGGDSVYVANNLNTDLDQLRDGLSNKFDIIELGIQDESTADYNNPTTDLSSSFKEISRLYDSRMIAGMVMISDGIYNAGSNPSFAAQQVNFPVYTIPVGDTTLYRDVSIYSAKANAVTFLGNQFPVEVVVNASKANGQNVELSIWHKGVKLDKKAISIQGNRFTAEHTFLLKATEKGNQSYTVQVSYAKDELNKSNNAKLVYTDVLDVKQKILIAAHAPHPDVAVLKKAILSNDQYELDVQIGFYDIKKPTDYDLVITHQLPVNSYELNFLQNVKENKTPLFAIIGTQTNVNLFNKTGLGMEISGNRANFNQGLAAVNFSFSLFDPGSDITDFINNAPPLTTPFGEYAVSASTSSLMFQKIGSVQTKMPLWSFSNQNGYRSGVCSGEGIWRWRFNDFEENESANHVDGLLRKTIQYLALKDDKRKFKVYTSSRNFYENERISFIGEVYNDSYEFTPDANVEVSLNHSDGTQYKYTLVPQAGAYRYGVGALPPGNYTYSANAQYNGAKFNESGSFVVKARQLENQNLTANYTLLRQLAAETGGQSFDKTSWSQLIETINAQPNTASVVKESSRFKDLISQKWLFFLVFGLLAFEWFVRRWMGGY